MRLYLSKFSLLSLPLLASIIPLAADDRNENHLVSTPRRRESTNDSATIREAETDDTLQSSNGPPPVDITAQEDAENDMMDDDGKMPLHETIETDRTSEHHAPGLESVTMEETDIQTASEIVHDDSLSSIPPRLPDELYKLGEEVLQDVINDVDVATDSDNVDGTSAASTSQEEDLVKLDETKDEIDATKEQNDQYDDVNVDDVNVESSSQEFNPDTTNSEERVDKNENGNEEENKTTDDMDDSNDSNSEDAINLEEETEDVLPTSDTTDTKELNHEETKQEKAGRDMIVNYASKSSGALILDKSREFKGTSNLLVDDKDKYAISPCDQEGVKYVIIGLSEDIKVKAVKLSSYERFSSLPKVFQVLGSQTYPMMTEWEDMGTYEAKPWYKNNGQQVFEMKEHSWARYLKFRFLSHYGDEHYCTITGLGVHGSTTLQGFHEMQWDARDKELKKEIENTASVSNEEEVVVNEIKPTDIDETEEEEEVDSNETVDVTVTSQESLLEKVEEDNTDADSSSSQAINVSLSASNEDGKSDVHDQVVDDSVGSDEKQVPNVDDKIPEIEHKDAVEEEADNEEMATTIVDVSSENDSIEIVIEEEELTIDDDDDDSHEVDSPLYTERSDDTEVVLEDNNETPEQQNGDLVNDTQSSLAQSSVNAALNTVKNVNTAVVTDAVKVILTSIGLDNKENEAVAPEPDSVSDVSPNDITDSNHDGKGESINDDVNSMEPKVTKDESLKKGEKASISVPNPKETQGKSNSESLNNSKKNDEGNSDVINTNISIEEPKQDTSTQSPSTKGMDEVSKSSKKATIISPETLDEIKQRSPNAECLESLDFQALKRIMMKESINRNNGGSESMPKNEPIFKKLTDEIKLLEASQRVYDQYIESSTDCFMKVFEDLAKDMASVQHQHETRMMLMEDQISQIMKREKETWGMHLADTFSKVMMGLATYFDYAKEYFQIWLETLTRYAELYLIRLLENKRIQQILDHHREILSFLSGSLFCILIVTIYRWVKRLTKPVHVQKRLEAMPVVHTATNMDTTVVKVSKRKRKKKSKGKMQSPPHIVPEDVVTATCSESLISLSSASIGY